MNFTLKYNRFYLLRLLAVFLPGLLGLLVLFMLSPIPQDPTYHNFADQRTLLGISHFGDVIGNSAFVLVGVYGCWILTRRLPGVFIEKRERIPYLVLFVGMVLTGIGSAWYHLSPSNESIFFDRLPMVLVFVSLFCVMIVERINLRLGLILLGPLLLLGLGGVVYWRYTESILRGDLRLYAWVQFYPMLSIPLMLWLFPPRYSQAHIYWFVLLWYAGAKLVEVLDERIFSWTRLVSGHNLKHLFAAFAIYLIARMLKQRQANTTLSPLHPR